MNNIIKHMTLNNQNFTKRNIGRLNKIDKFIESFSDLLFTFKLYTCL